MNLKSFIEKSNLPEDLIRQVVRQIGGWDSFKEHARDVSMYGANCGFAGFIYYTDTCRFYAVNRDAILEAVRDMCDGLGEEPIQFVRSFNWLKDATESEVGLTLYGSKKQHDTQVANALAWFALEEVARAFEDLTA